MYTKYPKDTIIQEGDLATTSRGLTPFHPSCIGQRSVHEVYRLEGYTKLPIGTIIQSVDCGMVSGNRVEPFAESCIGQPSVYTLYRKVTK